MRCVIIMLFLALSFNVGYSQGRLEKAEESLKKEKKERHNRNSRRSSSSSSSIASDIAGSIIEGVFVGIAEGLIDTAKRNREENPKPKKWLTKYPYHSSEKGDFSFTKGEDTRGARLTLSNRLVVVDPNLYGAHYEALFRVSKVAFEIDYLQLWEKNKNFGDNSLGMNTMVFHIPFFNMETGSSSFKVGATHINGEVDEWGFTIGASMEGFFMKPLSYELKYQGSFFEDSRAIYTATLLLNYYHRRWKVSGGFEYLKIGSEDFYMPTVGIGISL